MGQLTEWLADLHIKAVLIAVGVLLVGLTFFRTARSKDQTTVWLMENVQVILSVVVVVFLIIRPFLFQAFYIPSSSMAPTLEGPPGSDFGTPGPDRTGDRLLVDKLIYRVADPKRLDIAVFRAPKKASFDEKEFIKRVIGLPGETVEVTPPRLVVDGKPAVVLASEGVSTQLSVADRNEPKVDPAGHVAVLEPRFGATAVKVFAEPKPDVRWDPYMVQVDGKEELRDVSGQVQVKSGLSDFAGDPTLSAQVFSVNGDPRVIVVAGTKIAYQDGRVLINGQAINGDRREPYVKEEPHYGMPPLKLGSNEYFMMGDNRNNSNDGHAWGPLTRDRFIGRAEILFWPVNRFRLFSPWLLLVMCGLFIGYQLLYRLVASRT
jgi:signal peptidase I